MTNLVAIDYLFIVILIVFSFLGASKGFVEEALSLVSLFLSLLLATIFSEDLALWIQKRSSVEDLAYFIGFILIFVVSFFILKRVQVGLAKLVDHSPFEGVDRILGLLLGLIEGVLCCLLVVYALQFQSLVPLDKLARGSEILPYLDRFFPIVAENGDKLLDLFDKAKRS